MRIYLDNCCLNRPFDDPKQTSVRLEAEAKLCLQGHIRDGKLELAWSYILDFENAVNPFEERRTAIGDWKAVATIDIEETPATLRQARRLFNVGLKAKDALHLACALAGECTHFVTTDGGILKRGKNIQGIVVLSPISLVQELNL